MGGAGGEISPRQRRRKVPDIDSQRRGVTLLDHANRSPL